MLLEDAVATGKYTVYLRCRQFCVLRVNPDTVSAGVTIEEHSIFIVFMQ